MTKVRSSDLSAAAEALAAARLRRLPRPDQVRSDGAITRLSRRVPAVSHDSLQVLLDVEFKFVLVQYCFGGLDYLLIIEFGRIA